MRALILYWTITRTTLRVAERIANGLRSEGVTCELHDLRDGVPAEVAAYDLIGVGYPVHFYRPAEPASRAIAALGPLGGRPVFCFALHGTYRGAGLNHARRALARSGGTEIGAFACRGDDLFIGYVLQGYHFSPGHPEPGELDRAEAFGVEMARRYRQRKAALALPAPTPYDARTKIVYAVERAALAPWLGHHLYSRFFRADPARCTHCGRCVHACPTANISMQRGEAPAWARDCLVCGTCVGTCPEDAVRSPYDWGVLTPFFRYNVKHAARDAELDHERVEFKRGRITGV